MIKWPLAGRYIAVRRYCAALALPLCMLWAAHLPAYAAEQSAVAIRLAGVHIFVDVRVNGKPAVFVLDTGAGGNVITPDAARRLGLKPGTEKTPLIGAGGRAGNVADVRLDEIRIGGFAAKGDTAYVIPLPEGLPCDGILGTPFLRKQIFTIDYAHRMLTWLSSTEFHPPAGATALEMRLIGNTPFVEASADGHSGSFRIDTGAGNSITLFDPFVRRASLRTKYMPAIRVATGRGVGGLMYGDLVRMPEVTLGPYRLKSPIVELSRQTEGAFADASNAGNIGGEMLSRFTLTLDYDHARLYLAPNSQIDAPFDTPRSGLALETEKGVIYIRDVSPGSPASEAGILPGETITAIEGVGAAQINQNQIHEALQKPVGTVVHLRVRSKEGAERETRLTLRDLL